MKTTATPDENVSFKMVVSRSSVEGVKLANLPHPTNTADERVTVQVPTINSDSIAIESELSESEVLLVFSPKPYTNETDADADNGGIGIGQIFMIRTQLMSDTDFLKSFVPKKADLLK